MKYWLEYDVKTKSWSIYDTRTKFECETMTRLYIFSDKLFDRILDGVIKILDAKKI